MKTKLTLLTLATAGLLTTVSQLRAEDPVPPTPAATPAAATPGARRGGPGGFGGQRGDRAAMLKEQLGLTDEQVEKIKPILAKDTEKFAEIRKDTTLTREQIMAKMQEIQKASDEQIKPILTADQVEKWKAIQDKRREAMEKRRAEQGGAVATPPAAAK